MMSSPHDTIVACCFDDLCSRATSCKIESVFDFAEAQSMKVEGKRQSLGMKESEHSLIVHVGLWHEWFDKRKTPKQQIDAEALLKRQTVSKSSLSNWVWTDNRFASCFPPIFQYRAKSFPLLTLGECHLALPLIIHFAM